MRSLELDSTAPSGGRSGAVIGPAVIAAVAKAAALAVPGVLRTEPGISDLVTAMARRARQRVRGLTPASTSGVRVADADLGVVVEVAVTITGHPGIVGVAVQRAVTAEVLAATGIPVEAVLVSIVDVDPGAGS